MSRKNTGKAYSPNCLILANWAQEYLLDCPVCKLKVVRIVETPYIRKYVHNDAVLCEVRK